MVDDLKAYAESQYTDEEFRAEAAASTTFARPFTKESLLYRELFEKYYPGQSPHGRRTSGCPTATWPGCDVDDPSARVLQNYGASGE